MFKIIFTVLIAWLFTSSLLSKESMEDEAVKLLQNYLRVDTISPPGNESRAVEFFAKILEKEGIEYD